MGLALGGEILTTLSVNIRIFGALEYRTVQDTAP